MAGIFFNVTQFDETLVKLENLTQKLKNDIINETNASALKIQSEAKKNAPANFGTLRGSIHLKEDGGIDKKVYIVGSDLLYAPYVEFGTGTRFQIPVYQNLNMSDLEAYALTFKKSKKVIGVPYRPYMFSAYSEVFTSMIKKLKSVKI